MRPSMRPALRSLGGRRVTVLVIKEEIVDHEAVQAGQETRRLSITLMPLAPRKIALKPEGQRAWKWWQAYSTEPLGLGWQLKADRDGGRVYKVMAQEDWRQSGIYSYELSEEAQLVAPAAAREALP